MTTTKRRKRTLPWKDNLAYSMGSAGINFMFALISFYLMYFYTDVLGITAAAAGTLLMVARIWDVFNDPIMGTIVDRTHTRWGKFRPFIISGLAPCFLLFVLTFYTPNLGNTGKTVWAYLTYIPLLMAVTLIYIPYHAQSTIMTTNSFERAEVGALQQIMAFIATLVVTAGALPLVGLFDSQQKGFFYTASVFGFIAVISYMITFVGTKKYDLPKGQSNTYRSSTRSQPFSRRIRVLTGNRPLLSVVSSYLFFQIGLTIMTAVTIYFFKYYIRMEKFYPIFMGSFMVIMVIGTLFVPYLSRKMGKKNLYQLANLLSMISLLLMFVICLRFHAEQAAASFKFGPLFFISMFSAFWNGPVIALVWGIVPDTVEYAEWKVGIRAEGLVFALLGFMQKTALGIAGAVSGFVLSAIGYLPNRDQTPNALLGILILFLLIPVLFRALSFLAMVFYNLSEKAFADIVDSLKAYKN